MELLLGESDLAKRHRKISASQVEWSKLAPNAKRAVDVVGQGIFRSSDGMTHELVYSPRVLIARQMIADLKIAIQLDKMGKKLDRKIAKSLARG